MFPLDTASRFQLPTTECPYHFFSFSFSFLLSSSFRVIDLASWPFFSFQLTRPWPTAIVCSLPFFFFLSFALFLSSTTGLNLYIDYFFLGIFFFIPMAAAILDGFWWPCFLSSENFRVVKTQDLSCSFGSFSKVAVVWSSELCSECIAIYENCVE